MCAYDTNQNTMVLLLHASLRTFHSSPSHSLLYLLRTIMYKKPGKRRYKFIGPESAHKSNARFETILGVTRYSFIITTPLNVNG